MLKNKTSNKTDNKGFAAIMALLVVISLVLVITFSMTIVVMTERQIDKNLISSAQSYYLAESGIEDALLRVIKSEDYDEIPAINNFTLGDADISQSVDYIGNDVNIQTSSVHLNNKRKLEIMLHITVDDISFHYGVQVGEGGLTMGNNSSIIGNLYSDGSVSGAGTLTGDLIVAAGMSLDTNGVWGTYDSDMIFGENGEPTDIAMSFTPTSTGVLSQVSFYVKNSSPSHGSGIIKIVEDNAGSPSTTVLATDTFLASKVGSSYGWVSFSFSTPANLTGGNTYWIVIDLNSENNKHFSIGRGQWNANSVSKYIPWGGGSWATDILGDYNYKAWIGGLATSVNGLTIEGDAHAHEIINSTIAGDARYQVISNSTVGGTSYPGEPDPPVAAMPISDSNIAEWKADAESYGNLDSSICNQPTDITIDGGVLDCDFNPVAGITITLNGTLWVKGDITLGNNTDLVLDSNYGSNSGIIVADNPGSESTSGKILVENNIIICGSQGLNIAEDDCATSNGTYVLMLSTHSGVDPSYAIEVRNNASGAIFYAHNGTAHISNNAKLKEVTAYKLSLENLAEVTYESGLANASFSSGPGGGWDIDSWNEIE